MLPEQRGRQFRVRIDIRARLPCGLNAPMKVDLGPGGNRDSMLNGVDPIFIIQGAAPRHDGLPSLFNFSNPCAGLAIASRAAIAANGRSLILRDLHQEVWE